jgi:hypothetical protein
MFMITGAGMGLDSVLAWAIHGIMETTGVGVAPGVIADSGGTIAGPGAGDGTTTGIPGSSMEDITDTHFTVTAIHITGTIAVITVMVAMPLTVRDEAIIPIHSHPIPSGVDLTSIPG